MNIDLSNAQDNDKLKDLLLYDLRKQYDPGNRELSSSINMSTVGPPSIGSKHRDFVQGLAETLHYDGQMEAFEKNMKSYRSRRPDSTIKDILKAVKHEAYRAPEQVYERIKIVSVEEQEARSETAKLNFEERKRMIEERNKNEGEKPSAAVEPALEKALKQFKDGGEQPSGLAPDKVKKPGGLERE